MKTINIRTTIDSVFDKFQAFDFASRIGELQRYRLVRLFTPLIIVVFLFFYVLSFCLTIFLSCIVIVLLSIWNFIVWVIFDINCKEEMKEDGGKNFE